MGSKLSGGDGIATGKQSQCWRVCTNGGCRGTCQEYVSKDFQMLIAAVLIIEKLSEATVVSFNWKMVD